MWFRQLLFCLHLLAPCSQGKPVARRTWLSKNGTGPGWRQNHKGKDATSSPPTSPKKTTVKPLKAIDLDLDLDLEERSQPTNRPLLEIKGNPDISWLLHLKRIHQVRHHPYKNYCSFCLCVMFMIQLIMVHDIPVTDKKKTTSSFLEKGNH